MLCGFHTLFSVIREGREGYAGLAGFDEIFIIYFAVRPAQLFGWVRFSSQFRGTGED